MEQMLLKLQEVAAMYGLNILLALVIVVVGRRVAGMVANLVATVLEKAKTDVTVIKFLRYVSYYGVMIFVVLAALNQLGIHTTSLIAVLGAAGLAVGLAVQSSLSNFAAGLLLIVFRPFQAGHVIQAAGILGTVEEIQILTTRLVTPDNVAVIIPNAKLMGDSITNFTVKSTRRLELTVTVGYDHDLKKVKDVLNAIIDRDGRILHDPAPVIGVQELGPKGVVMVMRVWVQSGDAPSVRTDLNEMIKTRFGEEGISIPVG